MDDLAGLGRSHPGLALVMALFLFSLIGMPLTAGFFGKFQLFLSALQVERTAEKQPLFVILAVIAALNGESGRTTTRIVGVMFLREALEPLTPLLRLPALAAISICALVTILFGVHPAPLARLTQAAAAPAATSPPLQAAR